MAGITKVIVGEEVPISLQLPDGATDQYPRAEVRDEDGTLLTTLNLSHVAEGLYRPTSAYSMPNTEALYTTYIVYSDSGHTTESSYYLRDIDVFAQVDPEDFQADISALATTAQLNTVESNIRGVDSDDLKDLSDQLDAVQVDLDNPSQYQADISSLALEANVEGHVTNALNAYDPPTRTEATADKNEIIVEVNANETKIDALQFSISALNDISIADVQTALTNQGYTSTRAALLDNLDKAISSLNDISITDIQTALTNQGYTSNRALLLDNLTNLDASVSSVLSAIAALNDISQADVQAAMTLQGYTVTRSLLLDNLDSSISSVISAINALNDISTSDVWSYTPRTLTSFGSLVTDVASAVWSAGTRTLTSFGSLLTDIWSYATRTLTSFGSLVSDVDNQLSSSHGVGSWEGADLTGVAQESSIQAVKAKTDTISWGDITFLKDIEGGRWKRDGTQMIFYKADNVTEIARFELYKADGSSAGEDDDVFERERV